MYNVIVSIYAHGQLISSLRKTVNTATLRALRTLHGATNVTICI